MAKFERKTSALDDRLHNTSETVGNFLVDAFHYLALFAIGGTIVWSAVMAFLDMAFAGGASIHDILLLALANLVVRYSSARFPNPVSKSGSEAE